MDYPLKVASGIPGSSTLFTQYRQTWIKSSLDLRKRSCDIKTQQTGSKAPQVHLYRPNGNGAKI